MSRMEVLRPSSPAAISQILADLDRKQLEKFIETAIDMLDMTAGDPDMEDDDPAGDPLDYGEVDEWRPEGIPLARPIYGMDQSRGPINEAAAAQEWTQRFRES